MTNIYVSTDSFEAEAIIENVDTMSDQILKPCFDAIWNACGYAGSANYDPKTGQRLKRN